MTNALPLGRHVSRVRAQRLVAQGRLLIALFALLAAVVGVARMDAGVPATLILAAWSAIAAFAMLRGSTAPLRFLHALDIVVISAVVLLTGGVASPFWPLLVMPPFAANLLGSRRTLAWTIVASVSVFAVALTVTHEATDPQMMIMRLGVAVLLAVAAVRRSDYDERIQHDLEQLATWPRGVRPDRDAFLREQLERARTILRAPHAALAWREGDESFVATLRENTFELRNDDLTPEGEASLILDRGILAERLSAQRVIAARLASQTASGWLFALDPRSPDADVMTLAEVAGRLVSASIDEQNVAAMMRDSAAASERLRLSRDLHDGLLQSLGGLALHAQAARRSLANDPASAETRLAVVVQSLTDAQRVLRDFVDELRPELAARDSERAATTHGDVLALVSEGVANAVKHAMATKITCTIGLLENYIEIDIRDNGRGFPFEGRYDLAQLAELRRGPWSLKERVADRGGELVLDTTSAGTHIAIRLPC